MSTRPRETAATTPGLWATLIHGAILWTRVVLAALAVAIATGVGLTLLVTAVEWIVQW
ncbi:MAG: hypothetical protein ACRD0H_13425 [Actinomycetes bacterium]